jgi:hypothetical protein
LIFINFFGWCYKIFCQLIANCSVAVLLLSVLLSEIANATCIAPVRTGTPQFDQMNLANFYSCLARESQENNLAQPNFPAPVHFQSLPNNIKNDSSFQQQLQLIFPTIVPNQKLR